MVRVGITHNKKHVLHDYMLKGFPSPENPARVNSIIEHLQKNGVFDGDKYRLVESSRASIVDVLRVHEEGYVESIRKYAAKGGGFIGNDTYVCRDTFQVLLSAVGCANMAGKLVVDGDFDHTFALVRPPGHHAGAESYGGFCIFNNAAILARYLQQVCGLKKIAIINIDAHASNGTKSIFYDDPSVLCISVHQDPATIYPHDGFLNQIGVRPALGYTVNVEMPQECGNREYIKVFDDVVDPILDQFNPGFTIVECGFDAYYKEPLTQMNLSADGYYAIIRKLASKRKLTLLLEGGYHDELGFLSMVVLNALAVEKKFKDDADQISLLTSRRTNSSKQFEEKVVRLKDILSNYWQF